MKVHFSIAIVFLLFGILSCSVSKRQQIGYISAKGFNSTINFTTAKSIIVLPAEINGVSKNFLFDTGAELTLVQRDSTLGKTELVKGASNRKAKMGSEIVGSIKIGDIDFHNTVALNTNFSGLKEQISNFGGLIGQSIIRKANWLIDYQGQKIYFSDKNIIDSSFQKIPVTFEDGRPYIALIIDKKTYKALVDLGSSSAVAVPEGSKLANDLITKYRFQTNETDIYTIGGTQKVEKKTGIVPLITLGHFLFQNIETDIRPTSQLRVGNKFFKNCSLYIDNSNQSYFLSQKVLCDSTNLK